MRPRWRSPGAGGMLAKAWGATPALGLILLAGCAGSTVSPLPMTADVGELSRVVWYRCRGPGIQDLQAGWMRPGVLHIQGVLDNEGTRAELVYCLQRIPGVTEVVDQTIVIGPSGGHLKH